jgi:hypothetical protein
VTCSNHAATASHAAGVVSCHLDASMQSLAAMRSVHLHDDHVAAANGGSIHEGAAASLPASNVCLKHLSWSVPPAALDASSSSHLQAPPFWREVTVWAA